MYENSHYFASSPALDIVKFYFIIIRSSILMLVIFFI